MIVNNVIYSQHHYEINIVECARKVVQKLKNEAEKTQFKITIEQYAFNLKIAIQAYKRSINFDVNASENHRKRACIISPTHPAFDFWLALHLSIEDPDEISMLLDAYQNGEFGDIDNFIGHVQYLVIRIMKANVLFGFRDQKLAVINWVREKKNTKQIHRIGLDDVKVVINENNIEQLLYVENFIKQRIENKSIQNNFNTFNTYNTYIDIPNEEKNDGSKQPKRTNKVKESADKSIRTEPEFDLIQTSCTFEKAFNHFEQLTKITDSKMNAFLSKQDIEDFLCANFYFEEKERVYPAKPLNISIAQRHLNQLFYDFMVYYDFKTTYDKYGNYFAILKRTFQKRYYNTELTSFKSNFSRKYDNYPFKTLR